MSVYTYIFNRDEFDHYYNCSSYNVEEIPLETRRNIPHSIMLLALGITIEALYIPCVWAIYQLIRENRHLPSCYPYMFYLGVVDCCALSGSAFGASAMSFMGSVFCSAALLDYTVTMLAMLWWFAGNTTVVILALNRCAVLIDARLCDRLFKGRRNIVAWLAIPTLGGVVFAVSLPPMLFTSITGLVYFNPHIFYLPDHPYYHKPMHFFFNWFIVVSIIACYVVFLVFLFRDILISRRIKKHIAHTSFANARGMRNETKATIQVILTCFIVLFTSLGFIYSDYFNQFGFIILFSYVLYEGSPAVIYLSMNRSIRNRIFQKMRFKTTISQIENTVTRTAPTHNIGARKQISQN